MINLILNCLKNCFSLNVIPIFFVRVLVAGHLKEYTPTVHYTAQTLSSADREVPWGFQGGWRANERTESIGVEGVMIQRRTSWVPLRLPYFARIKYFPSKRMMNGFEWPCSFNCQKWWMAWICMFVACELCGNNDLIFRIGFVFGQRNYGQ